MKGVLFFIFIYISICVHSQNVVKWSAQYSKESSEITINALIDKNWHLYSQYISPNAGPIPTKIVFDKNKQIKFKGKPIEENVHAFYDENFMANLAVFDEKAIFKQKVKVKKSSEVKITITYMVCDDTRCLPPTDEIVTIKIDK
jgi:hypothetical protein